MLLRFCCLRGCFLCGLAFVVDCGASFGENFWRHVLHVVRGLGVFAGFLENFVFGAAAYFEIASGGEIAAFQDFCHGDSPLLGGGGKSVGLGGSVSQENAAEPASESEPLRNPLTSRILI